MWLPAGGHIEPSEDPLKRRCARSARSSPSKPRLSLQRPAPSTPAGRARSSRPTPSSTAREPDHVHVDFVYFCRVLSGYPGTSYDPENPIVWLDAGQLRGGRGARSGSRGYFAPDVLALGLEAIRREATLTKQSAALSEAR